MSSVDEAQPYCGKERRQVVRTLKRDVFLALFIKTLLILTAAFTIFNAAHRPHVDAAVMFSQLMR